MPFSMLPLSGSFLLFGDSSVTSSSSSIELNCFLPLRVYNNLESLPEELVS